MVEGARHVFQKYPLPGGREDIALVLTAGPVIPIAAPCPEALRGTAPCHEGPLARGGPA
jgi:hypothetical protein